MGTNQSIPSKHFDHLVELLNQKTPQRTMFWERKFISTSHSRGDDANTLVQMYQEEYPEEVEGVSYKALRNRVLMVLRVCAWKGGFLERTNNGYWQIRPIDYKRDKRRCLNSYRVEKRRGTPGNYEMPEEEERFVSTFYKRRQLSLEKKHPWIEGT